MQKLLIVILFTLISCATSSHKNSETFASKNDFISIMQGATDRTQTVINFLVPRNHNYQVEVLSSEGKPTGKLHTQKSTLSNSKRESEQSPWQLVNVYISDLNPGQEYTFNLNIKNHDREVRASRQFSTLDTEKKDWRFLIASCFSDSLADTIGKQAWYHAHQKNADAYLMIGDNVYADFYNGYGIDHPIDPRHFWERFVETRLKLDLYRQLKLVPVFAMWDDHDYGVNNGTRHWKMKNEAQRIFRSFFPQIISPVIHPGPGISYYLSLGDERLYFFDNRSFRDEKQGKAHLGKAQLAWFESSLKNWSEANRAFLVMGDQFFGKHHDSESYEGYHPIEFQQFLGILERSKNKYHFISGDRHNLELQKISDRLFGQLAYEITTSAMHAKLFPGSFERFPNSRRIGGVDDQYNYVVMELRHGTDGGVQVELKGYNEKDETLLKHKFHL